MESSQVLQVSQVSGHAADTPSSAHLASVCLFAIQVQLLLLLSPSNSTLNLTVESLHVDDVGEATGDATGASTGEPSSTQSSGMKKLLLVESLTSVFIKDPE